MKTFEWIYKPSGNCPVQAEGYFLGKYFYFRSRGNRAIVEFYNSESEFWEDDTILAWYVLAKTKEYKAGWLPRWYCKLLIFKGCFKFLLNRKQ